MEGLAGQTQSTDKLHLYPSEDNSAGPPPGHHPAAGTPPHLHHNSSGALPGHHQPGGTPTHLHHSHGPHGHTAATLRHDSPSLPDSASAMACCPKHGNGSMVAKSKERNSLKQLLTLENPLLTGLNREKKKKQDPKDVMKKRREKAICIVSYQYFT